MGVQFANASWRRNLRLLGLGRSATPPIICGGILRLRFVASQSLIARLRAQRHTPDYLWGYGAVGSAFDWQSKGHEFESRYLHQW